jgi:protein subunit release factor A
MVERAQRQLAAGKPPEEVVCTSRTLLTNKLLHSPSVRCARPAARVSRDLLEAANELFQLGRMPKRLRANESIHPGKLDQLAERLRRDHRPAGRPGDPSDQNRFRDLSREYAQLEPVVAWTREYRGRRRPDRRPRDAGRQGDGRARRREEIARPADARQQALEPELLRLLLPPDPNDAAQRVYLEVRAGTGGDEAAICSPATCCACTALRRALRLARRGAVSERPGEHGGFKEVVARIAAVTSMRA